MTARLNMFGLVVQDMAASLAFYRLLGLDLPAEDDHKPHAEVDLGGGIRLAWDTVETVRTFDPDWRPPGGGHRVALAFLLDSPGQVDATYDKLVSLGHTGHKEPWDAVWGQRYAIVTDPDGNAVDLYCPLA
ncbi:glyoxalase [Nonomuraea sp. NN258]|uniref:VOC family protein n=1 Tax=Nonomuraea antri TaxID=2730852 RepID=UPI0015685F7B|nr:VOC family protein [Nonomuraea antri]NRQ32262.1 glyoxalase [Nonomuraea antri]